MLNETYKLSLKARRDGRMNVLFVCRANISRSRVAKAYFDRLSKHQSESAGTIVGERDGQTIKQNLELRGVLDFVFHIMKEQGLDVTDGARRQVTPEMVDKADLVVVLAGKTSLPGYLLNNEKVVYWDIPDTLKMSYDSVLNSTEMIKQNVEELVKEIG